MVNNSQFDFGKTTGDLTDLHNLHLFNFCIPFETFFSKGLNLITHVSQLATFYMFLNYSEKMRCVVLVLKRVCYSETTIVVG